jgi:hypothetical protein
MSDRVLGQDTEFMLVQGGTVLSSMTAVKSFGFTPNLKLLDEGFIGEKENRVDEIYESTSFDAEYHIENKDIFDLVTSVIDRARRQVPGQQINAKTTINFPNGTRARVICRDLHFDSIPTSFGGRDAFGTIKLSGKFSKPPKVL